MGNTVLNDKFNVLHIEAATIKNLIYFFKTWQTLTIHPDAVRYYWFFSNYCKDMNEFAFY